MKCPHCNVDFHDEPSRVWNDEDIDGSWTIEKRKCSACSRIILNLCAVRKTPTPAGGIRIVNLSSQLVRPIGANRSPAPAAVSDEFADDYEEACLVLPYSPKASAALSRRCLQAVLRAHVGIKKKTLAEEIENFTNRPDTPSHISESVDAIRNIGNFAAHPIKSTSSGEVVPVEEGEADWNLDVLELLFDFLFVQPELIKKKKEALNKKLSDAGKPPMK